MPFQRFRMASARPDFVTAAAAELVPNRARVASR
jgi:hypothetical protein